MVYVWCIYGVYMVCVWCVYGVHMMYVWCICGVYMVYIANPLATLAPEGVDGGYQGSAAFPQEKPSTHHRGSSEPVWTGVQGLLPTWFRTPNRPTRNEWLKPTPLYRRPVRRMITQTVGWIFCIIFATCFEISIFFNE